MAVRSAASTRRTRLVRRTARMAEHQRTQNEQSRYFGGAGFHRNIRSLQRTACNASLRDRPGAPQPGAGHGAVDCREKLEQSDAVMIRSRHSRSAGRTRKVSSRCKKINLHRGMGPKFGLAIAGCPSGRIKFSHRTRSGWQSRGSRWRVPPHPSAVAGGRRASRARRQAANGRAGCRSSV